MSENKNVLVDKKLMVVKDYLINNDSSGMVLFDPKIKQLVTNLLLTT